MQFQLFGTGLDLKKACIFFVLGFAFITYVAALPLPGQDAHSTSTSTSFTELVRRSEWTAQVRYHENTMPWATSFLVNDIHSKITGVIQGSHNVPIVIEFPEHQGEVPKWNENNQILFDYTLFRHDPPPTQWTGSGSTIHQTFTGSGAIRKVQVGSSYKIEAKMNTPPV
ncbi:hypothetical protein GGU11DRAFT_798042 [Lentinula aff. detonsa]|uniref:Uncharacterized protein n=1 Tax=Lentinula aff. detonsa TaxID=2804958 RepID=A0AA38NBK0_9AGAR|nr:hypothetical protein GGU10DRAFT_367019 [Lentinula aff. detonsa]KAJ3793923.1 hypothetical protein GGU11DRAFT_798042 [Lentinula aff. detonsa]